MDLHGLLMKRRSVRTFEDRPVPDDVLSELLSAATNAPSGGNIQPLSIVVVTESDSRAALAEMVGGQPWVRNAPVSLIFCLDFHRVKRWAELLDVEFRTEMSFGAFLIAHADLMCAAQTVTVMAEASGLGSVYVGTIQSSIDEARERFGMPEHVVPLMILTLGYPKHVPSGIPKLPADVLIHRERYSDPDDESLLGLFEDKYGAFDDDTYLERAYVEVVEADRQQDGDWTESAKRRMRDLGIRNNADFLFRLRYPTDAMVAANGRLAESLARAGFSFPGMSPEE